MARGGRDARLAGVEQIDFELDGRLVQVPAQGSLLDALREELGVTSVKDGCSPQGQCGCCTVLVDGQPRVSCVTPVSRIAARRVTTLDGLEPDVRTQWCEALSATGGTQCGFCTPGIIMRLAASVAQRGPTALERGAVDQSLLAHLCRCTGWQTIVEAAERVAANITTMPDRDLEAASRRAEIEGGVPQRVGPDIAAGRAGFAEDLAPDDALVAVLSPSGEWIVGENLAEARSRAGIVPGRRTSAALSWPFTIPEGNWDRVLATNWVEPGYLELDATWCAPGGEPTSMLANGGAFGSKTGGELAQIARRLADLHGRAVRVRYSREDAVIHGVKRPPLAVGMNRDGTGVMHVARTAGVAQAVAQWAPGLEVLEFDVAGPETSFEVRGAVWVELAAVMSSLREGPDTVESPNAARARAVVAPDGVHVSVEAGDPLDDVVLRSYVIGAAHQALGWVRSEGLAVDDSGQVHDLTIRSFGILRASDTPPIHVDITPSESPPVAVGPAVLAAVAAAAWRSEGYGPRWPLGG